MKGKEFEDLRKRMRTIGRELILTGITSISIRQYGESFAEVMVEATAGGIDVYRIYDFNEVDGESDEHKRLRLEDNEMMHIP